MQCRIVPGFVTKDLVALQIKIAESGYRKDVVICSVDFRLISGHHIP